MWINKASFFLFLWIILPSLAYAQEAYTPPKMYFSTSPQALIELPVQDIIKPSHKPAQKKKRSPPVASKTIGVSKRVKKTKPVGLPDVKAQSLSPVKKEPRADVTPSTNLETSIAFLPTSTELTTAQKKLFEYMVQTYFIERKARSIIVKIYASPSHPKERNSAKRKALSRGINIRDYLLSEGVESEKIIIKAIGNRQIGVIKGELPDRADIEIVY